MNDIANRIAQLPPEKRNLLLSQIRREGRSLSDQLIPIRPVSAKKELSSAQRRLWFLSTLEPNLPTYNMWSAIRIRGSLNTDILFKSLNEIQRRHEVLRTRISSVNGQPEIDMIENEAVNLRLTDLRQMSTESKERTVKTMIQEETRQVIDLDRGPLMRCCLMQLEDEEYVFMVTIHHIVSDATSLGIFHNELFQLYQAYSEGRHSPLPELSIQYVDYAAWQNRQIEGKELTKHFDYWKSQLGGQLPTLQLPLDYPRPSKTTFSGAVETIVLPGEKRDQLEFLAQSRRGTLFMTLLAAYQVLLMRYSGQEDIVVGTPISGRDRPELESLIGMLLNTLPMRSNLSGNPGFRQLLDRVREVCLGAYSHQHLPFEKIVEEIKPDRDRSRSPIFQTMFTLLNSSPAIPVQGLEFVPLGTHSGTAKFDLTLTAENTEKDLILSLEYNTDLFKQSTIRNMLSHFVTILEGIAKSPDTPIWSLPMMTPSDEEKMRIDWNPPDSALPEHSIPELFSALATEHPDRVAVTLGDQQYTYGELNRRANQLAHYLAESGVELESRVGLCLPRSCDMIVALLGILKCGGAYVPLDAEYPSERLEFMVNDADVSIVLTHRSLAGALPGNRATVVCLDEEEATLASMPESNFNCFIYPDNLCYVMYTSGSTGTPKGVSITHRNVVRLIRNTNYVTIGPGDVLLQFATISFDASTFEIWGALLNGARLVVFPPGLPTLSELGELIQKQGITTLWLTAGLFHEMVDRHLEGLRPIRNLLAGGDVLSATHVKILRQSLPQCRLINGYGPTENTTFTCCHEVEPAEQIGHVVPIGRPIANTQVFILDRNLDAVPPGVPGCLYTSGSGVARGYFQRPQLTAERFIPNPFGQPGSRLYCTGDQARYSSDGTIEFLGRLDQQVKIRGFRIELQEIESVLTKHENIAEVVVVASQFEAEDRSLIAYIVARQAPDPEPKDLQQFARELLPDYMVPSTFVFLKQLPLSPNGKVDRKALPSPVQMGTGENENYLAPRNPVEQQLVAIWENLLNQEQVGVKDNYFDLGGHSLLAVRMFADIEELFGRKLPLDILFATPTIEELAGAIRQKALTEESTPLVEINRGDARAPLFAVPPAASPNLVYAPLARKLNSKQPFFGLRPLVPDGTSSPKRWFESTAQLFLSEIRRIRPRGPYHLMGRCFGAVVAYEVAQQLIKQGEEVALLALLDVGPPLTRNSRFYLRRFKTDVRVGLQNIRRRLSGKFPIEYVVIPFHPVRFRLVYKHTRATATYDSLIWDANLRAAAEYVTRPYPGRITLVQSAQYSGDFARTAWETLARDGVDYRVIPGSHTDMLREPTVSLLADELTKCLELTNDETVTGGAQAIAHSR